MFPSSFAFPWVSGTIRVEVPSKHGKVTVSLGMDVTFRVQAGHVMNGAPDTVPESGAWKAGQEAVCFSSLVTAQLSPERLVGSRLALSEITGSGHRLLSPCRISLREDREYESSVISPKPGTLASKLCCSAYSQMEKIPKVLTESVTSSFN